MKTIRELVEEKYHRQLPDCGDNSCMFGGQGGMRTNGGCRCVQQALGNYKKENQLRMTIQVLLSVINSLQKVIDD